MRTRMLSIPHDELLKAMARRIADWHALRLIKLRLKAPIEERDEPEVVGALSKRRF
jgi:RNA-directed DNA polymerase